MTLAPTTLCLLISFTALVLAWVLINDPRDE